MALVIIAIENLLNTGLVYCSGPPPPKKKKKKKKKNFKFGFFVKIYLQEQAIRVVGFVLKTLFTYFEMLIVSHASLSVNGHYSASFGNLIYCS